MTKKFVFGAAVVALAALVMAPAASAACGSVRTASTYNSGTAAFVYWSPVAGDGLAGTVLGNVWAAGAPAAYNPFAGLVPCTAANGYQFLYFATGGISLNLHMESCGNGCPAPVSTLAVLAQHAPNFAGGGPSSFLLDTVLESPSGGGNSLNFDFSTQAYNLVRISKPTVVGSAPRVGNTIAVTVTIPSHAAGLVGTSSSQSSFTGYKIVEALSVANPGNDAAAYPITLATVSGSGGAAAGPTVIQVDCTGDTGTGKDAWIATQLSFEGGAILGPVVSEPRRVHCNSNVADPKYKTVPAKKISGPAPTSH